MKKILVTGGAGFVGSHLCKRLVKSKNEVKNGASTALVVNAIRWSGKVVN